MTSVARISPHPQEGFRSEVVVQHYDGDTITNEETRVLTPGETQEFSYYPGRQITFREVAVPGDGET